MNGELAHWLAQHRDLLLTRWAAALEFTTAPVPSRNGYADTALGGDSNFATLLPQLYAGIVAAVAGDLTILTNHVDQITISDVQFGLPQMIALAFQLRRLVRDTMQAEPDKSLLVPTLLLQFDDAIEQTIHVCTNSWVERTQALIQEREFIAESLDSASASADRRALQLKALNEISQRLSASLEHDALFDLIGSSLMGLMGVAHVAIWISDANSNASLLSPRLHLIYAAGEELVPLADVVVTDEQPKDIILRSFAGGQLIFDANPDCQLQGVWCQPGCGVLALPLLGSAQPIGVIALQDPNPIDQLRLQQDLAQGVANQASIAFQNALLYRQVRELNTDLEQRVIARTHELQEERDRLSTTHAISIEVSSTLDMDGLLKTSLDMLAHITHAEYGSILLVESDTGHLVSRATLGAASVSAYTRFPMGAGIAGWVALNKKPTLIKDLTKDDRWVPLPEPSPRRQEGSMIAVPLVVQSEVLGVLTLSHTQRDHFDENHMRLLMACAGSIAVGINNANLFTMISTEAERRYELLDRQQKEASKIAAILQSLADGVIVCDPAGSVLTANPAAGRILNRDYEELLIWNLHELLERYLNQRVNELPLKELIARPLSRDNKPRIFSCDIRVGMLTVRITMGPVMTEDAELLGALVVFRDITLEIESDRLKTEFIGTMSHELRTPMTAIKGFTQLLGMGGLGPLNDTQREFVNTIYNNTERMIKLINDVLDITKIESGSVDLELRPLHLAEALSGVVAELRGAVESHGHDLALIIPPGLPLVRADASRLHQILHNLLDNAIKYTPRGGKILVEAREATLATLPDEVREALAADKRYSQIDIRDTGVGITPHELQRIFQRFYRTENLMKIEAGGTGLGLSIVKPLIELMGGRIWVESTLNEGSTFSFVLPAA